MICQSCNNCSVCKIFAAVRESLGIADVAVNSCTVYVPRFDGEKSGTVSLTTPDFISRSEKIREALESLKETSSPEEKEPASVEEVLAEPEMGKCAICGLEDTELYTCSECGKKICMGCRIFDPKDRGDTVGKVLCSDCW